MATELSPELFKALMKKGYPESFCRELAYKYLNTDYTAKRMLGYLRNVPVTKIEDVVDEMLAILDDRNRLVAKHEAERAQAAINELYNDQFEEEEE